MGKKPFYKRKRVLVPVAALMLFGGRAVSSPEPTSTSQAAGTAALEKSTDSEAATSSTDTTGAVPETTTTVADSERDDVAGCTAVDDMTVRVDLANNSSKQSSYVIDVIYRDGAGERLGDDLLFVNDVRSGETVIESSYSSVPAGTVTCEIADVDRVASEPGDVTQATCNVDGSDILGHANVTFTVSNPSSETSDFAIAAALTENGVRIGHASGYIDNVLAGETVIDNTALTSAETGTATCEVIDVQRTAS